ncbi:glutamate-gated chloride channel-like [Palaemon carinicauda]|uniref:glutamate-gated chloride channel-like n=1 Tax=Palaemon carinicauda TaxID=392227 RepID=UPI0035B64AD8
MKLKVDFTMRMRWSDARLRYKNLSPLSDLNYIEPNSVWVPRVELLNAEFPKTFTTDPLVNIVRLSGPEEDDPSRIYRDEVYEGSTNSMELTQRYNAPFSCTMDMRNFPFDNQHCQLLVRFSSAREFMEWNDLSTSYLGKELLAEYIVKGVTIQKATTEDYSLIVVDITFSRRYGYYLTSAYLPTIMLMIISYASLFCKKENCDLRVMMALTTLLVLYALYQQISDDLPRTSYTKAIDVWCFFSITFIFSQVILHVFVNLKIRRPCLAASCRKEGREVVKRGNKEVKSIRIPPGQETLQNNPNLEITRERKALRPKASNGHVYQCNLLDNSRVFYLVLFGIFCVIYWSVVLTSE